MDEPTVGGESEEELVVESRAPTHVSESWSKKVLYQKWSAASAKGLQLKQSLADVKKENRDLKNTLTFTERCLRLEQDGKSRADRLEHNLSVANVGKTALEDELSF